MSANKLVEPHWLEEHLDDPKIRILEFNWNATDAYDSWHIPGAQGWYWKEWLWDELVRDFPSPDTLANVVQPVALQMTQQLFATVNPLNSGPTAGGLLPIWVIPMFAYLMVVALDGKTKNAPQQIKYQKLHLLIICPILELIIVCEHAEMKS